MKLKKIKKIIMRITNIRELKDFILKNELTHKQINILLQNTLNVLSIVEPKSKEQLIIDIDNYWEKWGNYKYENPLFLDIN